MEKPDVVDTPGAPALPTPSPTQDLTLSFDNVGRLIKEKRNFIVHGPSR